MPLKPHDGKCCVSLWGFGESCAGLRKNEGTGTAGAVHKIPACTVRPPWTGQSNPRALTGPSKRGEHTQALSDGEKEHRLYSVFLCVRRESGEKAITRMVLHNLLWFGTYFLARKEV